MSAFTQRLSLQELIASGSRARAHRAVLRALMTHGALTDLEITQCAPVSRSGVCGRISELTAIGYVEESAPRRCVVTRKMVRTSVLTPRGAMALAEAMRNEERINAQQGVLVA